MTWTIIFFSGTGNTGKITEQLSESLRKQAAGVSVISLEQILRNPERLDYAGGLGLGFPVYMFTYPVIFRELFPILKTWREVSGQENLPFFLYSTYCRFNASSLHLIAAAVESLGYSLIAKQAFKCPSNGIASLQDSNSEGYKTVMYFENKIGEKIRNFTKLITRNTALYHEEGYQLSHKGGPIDKPRIRFVKKIEKARYPRLSINPELCVGCGLCAADCPDGNLSMDGMEVVIRDSEECLHCLRCLHRCPVKAVDFGPLVHGPNRYSIKVRNSLFDEACKRPLDTPEAGTPSVRRRWAVRNIHFWYLHRKDHPVSL